METEDFKSKKICYDFNAYRVENKKVEEKNPADDSKKHTGSHWLAFFKFLLVSLFGILVLVLVLVILIVLTCLLAAWLCDIDPEKTYTWYSGIWHGLFCIPNWIRSFFSDDVLCKANNYTTAYNVWWWIVFLDSLFFTLGKLWR